jgi:hypothetical protein
MNTLRVKPGWKSSEFWFTAVSFIFSGLYLLGLIGDSSQKEDLIRDVSHGVESVILIGGQLAILWKYINSRKEIKQTWWNIVGAENSAVVSKPENPVTPINSIDNNGKSSKTKSKPKTKRTNKKQPRQPK